VLIVAPLLDPHIARRRERLRVHSGFCFELTTGNLLLTRRRWIADEVRGDTAALTGEHALHLSRVLRARVGQEFDVATGDLVRLGKIVSLSDERVEFALGDEVALRAAADLTLVLAIFKFDRMEWAVEKCTEIGVARIIPVIARRTDAHLAGASVKHHERWVRIARQAAEQSRRAMAPEISTPIRLKEFLGSDVGKAAEFSVPRVVLAESEMDASLRDVLPPSARTAVLAVGPEGGWAEDEVAWFREAGWKSASLGPTILRAETAAIVGAALALEAMRLERDEVPNSVEDSDHRG
jgi:16S rRNA (uracil1498-N3)-methyltransferase